MGKLSSPGEDLCFKRHMEWAKWEHKKAHGCSFGHVGNQERKTIPQVQKKWLQVLDDVDKQPMKCVFYKVLYLLYALLVDLSKSFSIFLKVKITHLTPSLPVFMCVLSCFSGVWLFVTLWTVVCQPGSYVQARILEWVAMPSSRESSQPRGQTCISWVFCIGRWVPYQ